jgi:gamma-glutamylcyclotransferase (GGCT)/AIG2-like uncharacterized protein YtfP
LDHLFVYGTLRRGSKHEMARLLQGQAHFVGTGRMPGRLYGLGRFPGAVAAANAEEWVRGEVYRLDDSASLLKVLDEYEGADFERGISSIQMDEGRTTECWVFLYVGKLPGRLIESGDWLAEPI